MTNVYALADDWGDKKTTRQSLVQAITIVGNAIGAMSSGQLTSLGRWKGIMLANILCLVGNGISMAINFPCLMIGRFIFGTAAGQFQFFCSKFIIEITPTEIRGPLGGLIQLFINTGILIAFSIGFEFPHPEDYSTSKLKRFVYEAFALPMALSVIQMLLLLFVFRYDTPYVHKQRDEDEKLRELMGKIYKPEAVDGRIN